MKFKYKLLCIVPPLIFVLDQLTKWIVMRTIPFRGMVQIVPGYFDLVYIRNTGAAFGMFAGMEDGARQVFFYSIAVFAAVALGVFYSRLSEKARLLQVAVVLVFGGMAGNLLDRLRFGMVTDFLSVHIRDISLDFSIFGRQFNIPLDWPAFNVADSAITVAMVLFVISAFLPQRREI